ncbi:hypothetical protein [Microcoleus sp. B4-D4]
MSNNRDRASIIDRSFSFNDCFSRSTRCSIGYLQEVVPIDCLNHR